MVYLEAYYRPCRRVASIVWDDGTVLCYENTAAHPVLYKLLWLGGQIVRRSNVYSVCSYKGQFYVLYLMLKPLPHWYYVDLLYKNKAKKI